jgi:hypothetical protein
MINSQFYTCTTHFLLLYDNLNTAKLAREQTWENNLQNDEVSNGSGIVNKFENYVFDEVCYWRASLNCDVTFVKPNTTILIIDEVVEGLNYDQYWHVIVGEKIGWLLVNKVIKFDRIEKK